MYRPTYEQLTGMTRQEIVTALDNCLANAFAGGQLQSVQAAIQSQLYLNELARRDQDQQTRIMLSYTKWITIMTVAILILTLINAVLTYLVYRLTLHPPSGS